MEIFEANDWETIFKILDIVAEGAEGDAVRGGEGEGGETMRGGEGDVADAVRYGKGNREVEIVENDRISVEIENDGFSDSTEFDGNDIDLEIDVGGEKNVDDDAENRGRVVGDASSSSECTSDEDIIGSGDDFENEYENEAGDCKAVFNASEKYDPNFEIGIIFSSKSDFKDAMYGHAVKTRRSLKIIKNDSRRIYAICDGEGCEWRINALKVIDSFKTDPNRATKGFRKDVIKDIRCNVSKYQAYRAKRNALNAIDGATDDQFALLWDYDEELRKSNPRSNVIMMMTDSHDGNVNKKFAKFYVMFVALRVGFLSGCRPIIGVDGCHLKGPHGWVLLTAVSIDPNNNLYPLAYAIVSGETREAWEWFLGLLKSDLNMVREDAYTFISDKRKELISTFESVFPSSDKRYCVRHLHGNMKTTGFKGLAYKSALWNAARATTESEFKVRMEEMIKLNERVVDWLSDKPPVH
ncbi:hypothetical protein Sango_2050600 [Sesamum angolense]|uniref:Mutator-like transposase n=1 Tax=Sesamum angolense TaxID=2727404 RepID=A0AAE1WG89_9LAMI|nr:hypothetical protein Sango_2050600 [Sesamum angolense]